MYIDIIIYILEIVLIRKPVDILWEYSSIIFILYILFYSKKQKFLSLYLDNLNNSYCQLWHSKTIKICFCLRLRISSSIFRSELKCRLATIRFSQVRPFLIAEYFLFPKVFHSCSLNVMLKMNTYLKKLWGL